MKLILALALTTGLMSCSGCDRVPTVPNQVVQGGVIACETYALVLNDLAPRRRAGTMSASNIQLVNRLEPALTSLCLGEITPAAATQITGLMTELLGVKRNPGG